MANIECVLCNKKKAKWGSVKLLDDGRICADCVKKHISRTVANNIEIVPFPKMTTEQARAEAKMLEDTGIKEKEFKTVTLDMSHRPGQKEYEKLLKEGWQVSHSNKRGVLEWKPGQTDFVFEREI